MDFRTPKEASKWESLQGQAGASIDKLLKGQAQPEDLKSLSALLAKQHELAGKIFDEGVASAEATADAIVDKMNAERIASGKAPLTAKAQARLYKATFQEVLSASSEDILGTIKDYLEEHFADSREETANLIESAFDRLRSMTGDKSLSPPKESLLTRQPAVSSTPTAGSSIAEVARLPGNADTPKTQISPWTRLKSLFDSKEPEVANPAIHRSLQDVMNAHGVREDSNIIKNIETLNNNDTSIQATTPIDQQISMALKANNELRQRALSEWDNIKPPLDEDEKSNKWFRNLKRWFTFDKKKSSSTDFKGMLGNIGKVLLLALTAPELISSIAQGIEKYLNFDTISKFVDNTWQGIKEGGTKILDWIVDKVKGFFGFGSKSTDKSSRSVTSTKSLTSSGATGQMSGTPESQLATLKKQLSDAQALDTHNRATGAPTSPSVRTILATAPRKIQALQKQIDAKGGAAKEGAAGTPSTAVNSGAPSVSSVTSLSSGGAPSVGPSSTTGIAPAAALSGSSAGPAVKAVTSVQAAVKPELKDAITMPDLAAAPPPEQGPSPRDGGTASNSISLSSFGFASGDPTLNLINVGALV